MSDRTDAERMAEIEERIRFEYCSIDDAEPTDVDDEWWLFQRVRALEAERDDLLEKIEWHKKRRTNFSVIELMEHEETAKERDRLKTDLDEACEYLADWDRCFEPGHCSGCITKPCMQKCAFLARVRGK